MFLSTFINWIYGEKDRFNGKLPRRLLDCWNMIGGDSPTDNQYGIELILDMHGCDTSKFTRASITEYFERLCELIDMQREDLHFWDDVAVSEEDKQTSPHTQGTSAVQFILTSSIVIHTLDQLGAVYINIFSCKVYDSKVAEEFSVEWFGANNCSARLLDRV